MYGNNVCIDNQKGESEHWYDSVNEWNKALELLDHLYQLIGGIDIRTRSEDVYAKKTAY